MFKFFRKRKLTYLIYSLSKKDEDPSYHIDDIEYIGALQNIIELFELSFYDNPFGGSGAFQEIRVFFNNIFIFEEKWNEVYQLAMDNQSFMYGIDIKTKIDLYDFLTDGTYTTNLYDATKGMLKITNELFELINKTPIAKRGVLNRQLIYLIKSIKYYLIAVINLYIENHQLKIKKLSF